MATIKQIFRVSKIEAVPASLIPGAEPVAGGVRVTFAPAGHDAPAPAIGIQWPFSEPGAASFFVVNEDVELTFAKPA